MSQETKHCKRCDRALPITLFHRDKGNKDGHAFYCKDCCLEYGKQYRKLHLNDPNVIYRSIKTRQKFFKKKKDSREKPFSISQEDFVNWFDTQPKICHYCSLSIEDFHNVKDSHLPRTDRLTIDCMNNDLGYVKGNIVLCCYRCNNTKNNFFSYEDFKEIAEKYITPMWEKQLGRKLT